MSIKVQKIKKLLIAKGYYSYDHAISERCIKDIVNTYKKTIKPERVINTKEKFKNFKVETFDGGAYMTFFTTAENHKKALQNLQENSSDYKNIANENRDLTIKVIELNL